MLNRVTIKTFSGDCFIFNVNSVKDLLSNLKENQEYSYSMVCLYDASTEKMIKMEDELKNGQELFMVASLVDVEMDTSTLGKDIVNVEIEFISNGIKHKEDLFYYPSTGVIIEAFVCCKECDGSEEYRDLEILLEKNLKYPEYQKKLAIRDALIKWNKRFN
jgi:hypothetical protein